MKTVFANYTQSELDSQYNPRLDVDFQYYVDRWAKSSKAVRASASGIWDVSYGETSQQTLDIYLAAGRDRPIHIFFHGGYWKALNKGDFAFIAPGFRDLDTICVIVNYTLCPAVSIGDIVKECTTATAWVWKNAAEFGGNRDKISISGHSAGGHITAMLLGADWGAEGCPNSFIKKAVAISGLFDLEPLRLSFLNDSIRLTPASARVFSPINGLPRSSVPLLVTLGDDESAEFHRQSELYAKLWALQGNPLQYFLAEGLNHFSVMDEAYNPERAVGAKLFSWIS